MSGKGQKCPIIYSIGFLLFLGVERFTFSLPLDLRTGWPVTHNLVSATVIDTDPRVGDAWATAMLSMGENEGDAVAKSVGIKVNFIQDENDKLVGTESPALRTSGDVAISAEQYRLR